MKKFVVQHVGGTQTVDIGRSQSIHGGFRPDRICCAGNQIAEITGSETGRGGTR